MIIGLLGGPLMLSAVALLTMTEEDLLRVKVVTSSAPPSSEEEGTGEDESDEVVEGVNGQTTSCLSFRSSSCREYLYIFALGEKYFYFQLSGNHCLDGVYGVGQLGQGLGLVLAWTSS